MPIDFAAIAADFAPRYRGQLRFVGDHFTEIGKWLTARLKQAERLEMGSRRFPVVLFEGDALAVAIHPAQHRTLVQVASRGLGETVVESSRRFLGGFERVGEAVREEWLLPGLIGRIETFLGTIRHSVQRFALRQPKEMSHLFDPAGLSAVDLFGVAGLAYRALASSTGGLRALAPDLRESVRLFSEAFASPAGSAAAPGSAIPAGAAVGASIERTLPESLDLAVRLILSTILILPALPGWLGLLASAAWMRARLLVAEVLAGIEAAVFALRARVVDAFFVGLPDFMGQAVFIVVFLGESIAQAFAYWAWFARIWLGDMLSELIRFGFELTRFMDYWVRLINAVVGFFNRLLDFDLMPFLVAPLGLPAWVLAAVGALPRLTLGDVLDASGTAARVTAYAALSAFIASIRTVLKLSAPGLILYYGGLKTKLDLLQQVIDALFQRPRPYPDEIRPLPTPISFPNFFDAFFGPGTPDIAGALARLGVTTLSQLQAIVQAGTAMLDGFARTFAVAADRAARMGSPARYRALAERADLLAGIAFGGQLDELGRRVAERPALPMETALVAWLAGGGFFVIGAVIPAYVSEMRGFWQDQLAADNAPMLSITATSPHILARRARLARVRMGRLTIVVRGPQADEALVAQVAGQFKQAVEQAYVAGHGVIVQARRS
jgi:hypothetical protein